MPKLQEHPLAMDQLTIEPGRAFSANSHDRPLLATIRQTCKVLNCSRTKVFDLLKGGTLERRKIGRATRVTVASIQQLVSNPTCEGRQ